ncbi:MAG TPA: recombinase XerC, partial [Clostridiales bacterium]|nr:recombinase XerC [Clostridiales bacterium]
MDYRTESPEVLRSFLNYHETIKGHSQATIDEYFLDLRNFFRFLKIERGIVPRKTELDDISIMDVDVAFVGAVTLSEVYAYLTFLARDRVKHENSRSPRYGLSAASRARKVAVIRSFYKYLTVKAKLLKDNPVADLDSPKLPKSLPRYLSLEESQRLLSAVDGANMERDYCILTLFLNCGLRISELVGLNVADIAADHIRIMG